MQTVRKHPRTLQEAFGPYTSRDVHEPVTRSDRVYGVLLATAIGVVGALLLVHWGST